MIKRSIAGLATAAALAGFFQPAFANHTGPGAGAVDEISGTGAGVFAGTLTGSPDVDSHDWFTFFGTAGTAFGLSTVGSPQDTYLKLYFTGASAADAGDAVGGFQLLAENDDAVGVAAVINGTLGATGHYLVDVSQWGAWNDAYTLTIRGDVTGVPVPGTLALLGVAFAGLAAARRRTAR